MRDSLTGPIQMANPCDLVSHPLECRRACDLSVMPDERPTRGTAAAGRKAE
jgi:hypothetical protein